MITFWNSLFTMQKVFFCTAIIATVFLLVQMILLFAGVTSKVGSQVVVDKELVKHKKANYTIKGIFAFLAVGSWAGFGVYFFLDWTFALMSFIVVGLVGFISMPFLYKRIYKLIAKKNAKKNSIKENNCVAECEKNENGEVINDVIDENKNDENV